MAKQIGVDDLAPKSSPEIDQSVKDATKRIMENVRSSDATLLDSDDDLPSFVSGNASVKLSTIHVPPPMMPQHGSRENAGVSAMAFAKSRREELGIQNATAPTDWLNTVSYIECHDRDCLGPAIWVIGDPTAWLTEANWHSAYHALGNYWAPDRQMHCQCCEVRDGRRLRVRGVDFISIGQVGNQTHVGLVANPRYVRHVTRAKFEEKITKFGGPKFDDVCPQRLTKPNPTK
jgi:hypothetical protein